MKPESQKHHGIRVPYRGTRRIRHFDELNKFNPQQHLPANVVVFHPTPRPKLEPTSTANPFPSAPVSTGEPSVVLEFRPPGPRSEARLIETTKAMQDAHRSTTRLPDRAQHAPVPMVSQVKHAVPDGFTEAQNLMLITVHTPKEGLKLVATYKEAQRSHTGLHRGAAHPELIPL